MAIIAVITGIVLIKYLSFDSTVVLKNEAYEVALLLRETQVKSVSVQRSASTFDFPYGMTFSYESTQYNSFYFSTSTPYLYPSYGTVCTLPAQDDCAEDLLTFYLPNRIHISDICYTESGQSEECASDLGGLTRIDISFRRPEFVALINVDDTLAGGNPDDIVNAKIFFESTRPGANTGTFVVEVSKLGQISTYKQ